MIPRKMNILKKFLRKLNRGEWGIEIKYNETREMNCFSYKKNRLINIDRSLNDVNEVNRKDDERS